MGRRPNAIIIEFFERGAKLDDNSNRYKHTCKRCGEEFPKGRLDSLTSHLLRKCANVTDADRFWVFDHIARTAERPATSKRELVRGLPPSIRQEDLQSELALPIYHEHQVSALDTLAEVSRRHLDLSSQRAHNEQSREAGATLNEIVLEQTLLAQLNQQPILGNTDSTNADPKTSYLSAPDTSPGQGAFSPDLPYPTMNMLSASPLVQTASAANQQLECAQAQNSTISDGISRSLVDPDLNDLSRRLQTHENGVSMAENQNDEPETRIWCPITPSSAQQSFGTLSIPANEHPPGFGLLHKPTTHKKRSRFDDNRRKEVSEIRKRGACLRCRMLKKPCSEGNPCSTCSSVESARLWKGKCLRTRLAGEFTLWSTNLFHSKARTALWTAVPNSGEGNSRIGACFFPGNHLDLTLAAQTQGNPVAAVDPSLKMDSHVEGDKTDKIWLSEDSENLSDKVDAYVNQLTDVCIEYEASSFLQATLQRACDFVRAEEAEKLARTTDVPDQQSTRSCYSLQNQLVKNTVELWVATRILTSRDPQILQFLCDPSHSPQNDPNGFEGDAKETQSATEKLSESSESHRLIRSQIMAAIESRCSKLSKIVMNELERRLLQRQQVSRFATFLSAVILLNCVERMSAMYRSFDTDEQMVSRMPVQTFEKGVSATKDSNRLPTEEEHQARSWPLDKSASSLWPQGQHFSELLTMLLRMRGLPPKTTQMVDGTLVVTQDFRIPVHVNGRPMRQQTDDQTNIIAAWLDPLKLSVSELMEKRDGPVPGKQDAQAWDLRFVSGLLLLDRTK